jgi:hypothetical protein
MKLSIYIDAANLHKGSLQVGLNLDYRKLKIWLQEKFKPDHVFLFIGHLPSQQKLYRELLTHGFDLIYKEVVIDDKGKIKGNCDADLVLKCVSDFYENKFTSMVLISSDGDYAGLVKFMKERDHFHLLISPSNKCSFLLRKLNIPILYLITQKNKINKTNP